MSPDGFPRPYGLLAELTHRCPLHCPYCSNPLQLVPRGDELSAEAWIDAIHQAAALGVLQIGFSGGEPLLHPDLPRLIQVARGAGLYSNLITSGIGLNSLKAQSLRDSGLDTVQLSFQSDEETQADVIAGVRVHRQKLAAVEALRGVGIPWSANVVLHRQNIERVGHIIDFIRGLGAIRLELANTQFYGWAFQNLDQLLPSRIQVEVAAAQVEASRGARMQIIYVLPDYHASRPKPCLHGWGARGITINPRGDVLPCQAAEAIPGMTFENVRDRTLAWIWRESESFNRFRGTSWMPEPCQSCEFREVDFGGCRCQAALLTGNSAATDPVCEFSSHRPLIDTLLARESAPSLGPSGGRYRGQAAGQSVA